MLKEQLNNVKNNKIHLFKKCQYSNSTRAAYQDLISFAGVSANKVQKVVDIVLTQISGIQVDRLPKSTFAKDMAVESRRVAQYKIASELSAGSCTNMTLHSDGTTKHGRSFTTFDLVNQEGKLLVCGLREVRATDAQSQLDLFCEILEDVCCSVENKQKIINKTFINIRNLMSDLCNTQKKFNKLFVEFRKNILKHTVNFHDLSKIEQEKLVEVNQFFCGLHYLVGLVDRAEACLKIWESIIHKDRKVGSIAHGGYSNGESGMTRLIRTVCKSVQERGCEKSGKIVCFATYLKDEFGITSIPVFPFLCNRFNILFVNAARVYFLYDQLIDFSQRIERNNKLLDAVY